MEREKVGVVFVGQGQTGGLQPQPEASGVAVKARFGGSYPEGLHLLRGQKALVIPAGPGPLSADSQIRTGRFHPNHPQGLGEGRPFHQPTDLDEGKVHQQGLPRPDGNRPHRALSEGRAWVYCSMTLWMPWRTRRGATMARKLSRVPPVPVTAIVP